MKIAACYVVCNEERLIAESLRSVKAYVDRYVIVDCVFKSNALDATHSTDHTKAICEKVCAPIPLTYIESSVKLTEQDARNAYLNEVENGDWILWLDGDEVLYGGHRELSLLVKDIREGKMRWGFSFPTYTTAVLCRGLGKDMPEDVYNTAPLINTFCPQMKLFQKLAGDHYINSEAVSEDAVYDSHDVLVTNRSIQPSSTIIVINHHVRQSHQEYVADCIRTLTQRAKQNLSKPAHLRG
jgi:glycosyltransferase involved in cell wall biosynthesis